MTFAQHTAATYESSDLPRDTATKYLVRCCLGAHLFTSAVVASGVALYWSWETAARLFPVLEFLPSMLMMLMCMRHGTRRSNDEAASPDERLPRGFPTSSVPQR
jgi:hypothetical protein